ncbi:MAG: signal peptidase I [Actinomycetes bacterium]
MLVLVVLGVAMLVRTFLVTPFSIPSGSMEQTLQVGDRILVDRASYRFRDVRHGDVVVFDGSETFGPVDGGPPPRGPLRSLVRSVAAAVGMAGATETDYVKRVIGVGGDRVVCCDDAGRLTVNGRRVDERAYLHPGDDPSELQFDVEVPAGRLWVMGDHRSASRDSRAHLGRPGGGTVPVDDVVGRVVAVMWPLPRLGGVS